MGALTGFHKFGDSGVRDDAGIKRGIRGRNEDTFKSRDVLLWALGGCSGFRGPRGLIGALGPSALVVDASGGK